MFCPTCSLVEQLLLEQRSNRYLLQGLPQQQLPQYLLEVSRWLLHQGQYCVERLLLQEHYCVHEQHQFPIELEYLLRLGLLIQYKNLLLVVSTHQLRLFDCHLEMCCHHLICLLLEIFLNLFVKII